MVEFLLILSALFFVAGFISKIVSEQMKQKAAFYGDIVTILRRAETDLAAAMRQSPVGQDPVAVWGCTPCRRANLVNEPCPWCGAQMKAGDPTAIISRATYTSQKRMK